MPLPASSFPRCSSQRFRYPEGEVRQRDGTVLKFTYGILQSPNFGDHNAAVHLGTLVIRSRARSGRSRSLTDGLQSPREGIRDHADVLE
jgi:hypothetical protein